MWYCKKCGKISMNLYILDRRYVLMTDGRYLRRHRSFLGYGTVEKDSHTTYRLDCDCKNLSYYDDLIEVKYNTFTCDYNKIKENDDRRYDKDYYNWKYFCDKEEDREKVYNSIREQMLNIRKTMRGEKILYDMG